MARGNVRIDDVAVAAYTVPTATPEADGTLAWDSTTAVTVSIRAGGITGLGWSYSGAAAGSVVTAELAPVLMGSDPCDVGGCWTAMRRQIRNLGDSGLFRQALSAVDIALWDLKARLLEVPLSVLFGRSSRSVRVYGSGGFTSLDNDQLAGQVQQWRDAGCTAMKIKIAESRGSRVDRDLSRLTTFSDLAGPGVELMVDANGGYSLGEARRVGAQLDERGVVWFEEPVSSADVAGLRVLRDALRCDVAAGEYIANLDDAQTLSPAVDCLQLDVTRCGGYTGWLRAAAVAEAHHLDVSCHCAPALHSQVAAAVPNVRHLEWFFDHMRVEGMLFTGVPRVRDGEMAVGGIDHGHGMAIADEAAKYRVPRW